MAQEPPPNAANPMDSRAIAVLNEYNEIEANVRGIKPDREDAWSKLQTALNAADSLVSQIDRPSVAKKDSELIRNSSGKALLASRKHQASSKIDQDMVMRKSGDLIAQGLLADIGQLALLHSVRPPTIDFMVGPIWTERRVVNRRAAGPRVRLDESAQKSADQLSSADIDSRKDDHQTETIRLIHTILAQQVQAVNGPVQLYEFIINPHSFAQTVENMFFLSFLVKDGRVSLDFDEDGLPVIYTATSWGLYQDEDEEGEQERGRGGPQQAVVSMDEGSYHRLIELYGIEDSIIPHRQYD